MNRRELEQAARAGHARGQGWLDFHEQHGEHIKAIEPVDRLAYHRLANRLLSVLVSGTTSGMYPPGDDDAEPWRDDDFDHEADFQTAAVQQTLWDTTEEYA